MPKRTRSYAAATGGPPPHGQFDAHVFLPDGTATVLSAQTTPASPAFNSPTPRAVGIDLREVAPGITEAGVVRHLVETGDAPNICGVQPRPTPGLFTVFFKTVRLAEEFLAAATTINDLRVPKHRAQADGRRLQTVAVTRLIPAALRVVADALSAAFGRYGEVAQVKLHTHAGTEIVTGPAYVSFDAGKTPDPLKRLPRLVPVVVPEPDDASVTHDAFVFWRGAPKFCFYHRTGSHDTSECQKTGAGSKPQRPHARAKQRRTDAGPDAARTTKPAADGRPTPARSRPARTTEPAATGQGAASGPANRVGHAAAATPAVPSMPTANRFAVLAADEPDKDAVDDDGNDEDAAAAESAAGGMEVDAGAVSLAATPGLSWADECASLDTAAPSEVSPAGGNRTDEDTSAGDTAAAKPVAGPRRTTRVTAQATNAKLAAHAKGGRVAASRNATKTAGSGAAAPAVDRDVGEESGRSHAQEGGAPRQPPQ